MTPKHSTAHGNCRAWQFEEQLEIFDARNQLIMYMPRGSALRQQLRRRVALAALMDGQDRLFVTRLAKSQPFYPGCWNISAMGYTHRGETVEEAAQRELLAGLNYRESSRESTKESPSGLRLVISLPPSEATRNAEVHLFRTKPCAVFPAINREILDDGLFLDQEEVAALLREMPESVSPALALGFRHIYGTNAT